MKRPVLRGLRVVKRGLDEVFGSLLQRWRRAGPPDLRPYGLQRGASSDPSWLNLRRITLRLLSRELSGVSVRGRPGHSEARAVTDREGYFELRFGEVQALGVDLRLVSDSLAAAQHARAAGLISPGALRDIAAGVAEDRAARDRH